MVNPDLADDDFIGGDGYDNTVEAFRFRSLEDLTQYTCGRVTQPESRAGSEDFRWYK